MGSEMCIRDRLFTKGMEQNASREEFGKAINGVLRVAEIFSTRKSLTSGEYFWIDYVPGTGSTVFLNGKPMGAPIKEPEFFSALLRIWLGKAPAETWMIGDSSNDARAAAAAGCPVLLLSYGYNHGEPVTALPALQHLDRLDQISLAPAASA